MRVPAAWALAITVLACHQRASTMTAAPGTSTTTTAATAAAERSPRGEARFAGVLPASAPPFAAEGPIAFHPGFARRSYHGDGKRVEITVAALGKEPGAYERWVAASLAYPQAPLPPDEANGFFTCAGNHPGAGCDLHIQTRSGFHVEVMGDGHVPRSDLLAVLGHLRLGDLTESFPSL